MKTTTTLNEHMSKSPNTFLDEVFCFMSSCVTNLTTNKMENNEAFCSSFFLCCAQTIENNVEK